jgi:hypothetical protein
MHPIITFIFGCLATGTIIAGGAYYAGLTKPDVLIAVAVLAAGLHALFFLVWYLVHVRRRARADEEAHDA